MDRRWLSFVPLWQFRQLCIHHIVKTYLGKIPWDAVELFFGPFDHTLQPTVGVGVALVELKTTFIGEEAAPSFWQDVSDSIGGHNFG